MLMDKLSSAQARDIDVNQEIYKMLLQKLETAKITQRLEASRAGTRYTVLDPPRLPLGPVKPNKLVVTLVGLFMGLGLGVGLVFAREFMDQSILDVEDAKRTVDLEILGAISRITTQEEMDKERAKLKFQMKFAGIVGVALLVVSLLIYLLLR
jgi:polysaccharide biosynthesis transport protein